MTASALITLSIVSHGQGTLIRSLLSDLESLPFRNFEVIITLNLPEDESPYRGHNFSLRIIRNKTPKGFGANHNSAFRLASSRWFAVVNPDIRISRLNIDTLLSPFQDLSVAAVAPLVLSIDGTVEDSARRFPTFLGLAKRVIFGLRQPDYRPKSIPYRVDWVAGMFIVFRRDAFEKVGGFDDRRYFMYFEDVDICRRLGRQHLWTLVNPSTQVIHSAQRASHRNPKHMLWHVTSAFRYLTGL